VPDKDSPAEVDPAAVVITEEQAAAAGKDPTPEASARHAEPDAGRFAANNLCPGTMGMAASLRMCGFLLAGFVLFQDSFRRASRSKCYPSLLTP